MIKDKDVLIEVVEKDGTLIEPKDAKENASQSDRLATLDALAELSQEENMGYEAGTHIDVNFNDITSVKEKLG